MSEQSIDLGQNYDLAGDTTQPSIIETLAGNENITPELIHEDASKGLRRFKISGSPSRDDGRYASIIHDPTTQADIVIIIERHLNCDTPKALGVVRDGQITARVNFEREPGGSHTNPTFRLKSENGKNQGAIYGYQNELDVRIANTLCENRNEIELKYYQRADRDIMEAIQSSA